MALGGLTTRVLPDANVWFSRTLRDWIGMGSVYGPDGWYEVHWTEDILAEALYHLRKKNPDASDSEIGGVRDKIVRAFASGRITGFSIESELDHPDIYDAHVHSAAVHGEVDFVITADGDFDDLRAIVDELPYEIHSPDSFLCLLDDSSPKTIRSLTRRQLVYWAKRRDGKPFNLCSSLSRAGAPNFAERVREHLQHC